jgi:hypothetical protein
MKLQKIIYGGNLAYLLVHNTLILRIPPKLPQYYYKILLIIEKFLSRFQNKLVAMWVLALWQKR